MNNPELKPCPFCGGENIKFHDRNKDNKTHVQCLYCGAKIERAHGIDVIDAWNRRC